MSVYFSSDEITLHHGDALEVARTLPDASVQTIVTSPPYYGLRDYGEDGQYGAEGTVEVYVEAMVALFRELRRVLADDGTLWLNLGDSFASGTRTSYAFDPKLPQREHLRPKSDLPAKNLLGVPWRVAFGLQADGWILRSDIIWHKPSGMPESVTDRPTKAHEYLFLFAKSPSYFYDSASIAEPAAGGAKGSRFDTGKTAAHQLDRSQPGERADSDSRNKRDVWMVATVPFPGAHFAVYPPELIRPCILAGSRPGDTVLDPFSGSGTTGQVATFEGRKYIGIDLNAEYLEVSLSTRFQQPTLPWGGVA